MSDWKITVQNIVDTFDLPRPVAQAVYVFYHQERAVGNEVNVYYLCGVLARALEDSGGLLER